MRGPLRRSPAWSIRFLTRGGANGRVLTRGLDPSRVPRSASCWGHPNLKLRGSGGGDIPESRGSDRDQKVRLRWPDLGILCRALQREGALVITPGLPESKLSFRSSVTPESALAVRDAGEGRSSAVQSGNSQEDLELKSPGLEDWKSRCSELAGGPAGKEAIQRLKRRKTENVCRLLC